MELHSEHILLLFYYFTIGHVFVCYSITYAIILYRCISCYFNVNNDCSCFIIRNFMKTLGIGSFLFIFLFTLDL